MANTPRSSLPRQWRHQWQKTRGHLRRWIDRNQVWILRSLLFANGFGALAMAVAFQASSSDLRIVTQTDAIPPQSWFCIGDIRGPGLMPSGIIFGGPQSCPTDAKSAAVVLTDKPWLFRAGLWVMAISSMLQIAMVKR